TCTDCPSQIARRTKQIAQSIVYKPDGSVWDERSEPILDSENNIVGFLEITQNISSKVQRDNALRQVEHKLSTVVKLLDVGISITDQVGNIIDCNNASEAILGITKEEHLARNYAGKQWDIIRPDYSPMPPEEFASVRALTDKCTVRDVVMGVRKPSGLCWISVNASPLDIPGYGVVITYIDITASVTARAALQESEMKFRSVFEHSIDSIVVLHAGRCLFVNPAFYSLFNYDENDTIIGQAILSFIARPERIKFVALSRKIENKEIAESRMYCLGIKKDGSEFHISLSISSYDLNGKNYILAILRDVSESKRAEIALRESREQFASAFEYAAIGKALVSTQGQFMKVNKALCAFLGYTADELMALTFQEITHPDDLNLDLRYLGEMLDGTRDCYQMEKRYFAKNGKLVWVLLSVSLVKTDTEEPLHFISQIQDITHRKRAEQSLLESEANFKDLAETVRRQNLELQKLNSDKDLFISIIAHDLKSPFSSILGFTKLLLKNFVNYSPEKIVKQLQLIESSAKNTYNLLEEILHWARAQSGKLPFEPIFFNLHQNIQENIENLSLFARGKQITISNTVPQAYIVCADANMINTVLRNLLSNAIKFTNPKGQIQISAQRTEGNTRVSITDNGIGIDPLKLAQLFVVSHKTSTQGTAQESGTGLGLPICKELIEIHGGEIWAKSKPNEGSKFTFTLPKTLKFTPQKLD
ncbi:MAG: hypothetical protein RIS47_1000, partial [Bacteroidota bacterium]